MLTWDNGGFVLFYKRLEQGRFRLPAFREGALGARLQSSQLAMLLDGIDLSRVRRPKQWVPPHPVSNEGGGIISTARWHQAPKTTTVRGGTKPNGSQRSSLKSKTDSSSSRVSSLRSSATSSGSGARRCRRSPSSSGRRSRPISGDAGHSARTPGGESRAPQRVVEHRVPEEKRTCPKCGSSELRPVGDGKRTYLHEYVPARFERQVHVQETLACRCGEGLVTAEGPRRVVDKCQYGPGLLAHVVTAKCADSIPLYRQAKALARAGIPINRTTLGDLFHTAADVLAPLPARILQLVREAHLVRADETPIRVLAEEKTRRGYIWTFRTQKRIAYEYSASRSGETPARVLEGTKGYLLVDAYSGYNAVTLPQGRIRVGCWAHVRRKFFDALSTAPEAQGILDLILSLYRVEHAARDAGRPRPAEAPTAPS